MLDNVKRQTCSHKHSLYVSTYRAGKMVQYQHRQQNAGNSSRESRCRLASGVQECVWEFCEREMGLQQEVALCQVSPR